jgi:acetate kinase
VDKDVANEGAISVTASRVAVRVIHTDEEWMIASTVCRELGLGMAVEKGKSDRATKDIH